MSDVYISSFSVFSSLGLVVSLPVDEISYLSLEIDTNCLSSKFCICEIQKASMGSVMSNTSIPLALKPSKCGLLLA